MIVTGLPIFAIKQLCDFKKCKNMDSGMVGRLEQFLLSRDEKRQS